MNVAQHHRPTRPHLFTIERDTLTFYYMYIHANPSKQVIEKHLNSKEKDLLLFETKHLEKDNICKKYKQLVTAEGQFSEYETN